MKVKGNLMKKTYQITEKGKGDLEVELADLKSRRGEIAEKIAVARDFGDLRENAEYDAARKEQGLVETRIAEIEEILQNAEIIQSSDGSAVVLGSTVELRIWREKAKSPGCISRSRSSRNKGREVSRLLLSYSQIGRAHV